MQSVQSIDVQPQMAKSIPKSLQCQHTNPAANVCLNQNCSQYVFLCNDRTCECYKSHKGCIKGSIESITEALQEKILSIEPFQNKIHELIQNAIDQLSDYRERILEKAKKDLDFIGLTENERKFMKAIRTYQVKEITGKQMSQIFLCINNTDKFNQQMEKVEHKINQTWEQMRKSMLNSFYKIQALLCGFSGDSKFNFFNSLIIKTQEQKTNLSIFLGKKMVLSTLLYRGSENDFKASIFFENCEGIKNTLVICETQHGKLIGGFTPVPWKRYSSDAYIKDESGQSFIFSLTNNDKFTLQNSNNALRYYPDYGPMFGNGGGTDFSIINSANTNKQSICNIGNGYYNQKYTRNNNDSWEKFSGQRNNHYFCVKDWEVWKIDFQ